MPFQQANVHAEAAAPPRASSNNYNPPHARAQNDAQSQGTGFSQGPSSVFSGDSIPLNALLSQFTSLGLPAGAPAPSSSSIGAAPLSVGGNTQFFMTADGQVFCGPVPGMYPAPPLATSQIADGSYGYSSAIPYMAQTPYGYIPGYSVLPYTPGRAGYYAERSDHLHKEAPGLENRRGSYSTTESVPGTPYYGPSSLRDQVTQIAPADRFPFGSTPSPQQVGQTQVHHIAKPMQYRAIPVDIDISALLLQHPAIPRAVPAVFTPRESMRTLDQSLSNPIQGNRNVYIRGLHPHTDDETLAAYAARFGKVETSKAIIDTSTGACKG